MRSGLCNCLAIYDWDGDIKPIRFHEIAKAMFDANGILPDIGSDSGAENGLQSYSDVVTSLPSWKNGIDFYHTIPGHKQLVFGWDAFASLSTSGHKTMLFCFGQKLANLNLQYFELLVRMVADEVDLKYGIGYQRDFELGPDMYAYGMITGLGYSPRDMAEADRIGTWMYERPGANRHLQGYLRDVYPLNVVSSKHLAREVGNLPLAQWIEQTPDRGHLAQFGNDSWLWKVAESHLAVVRADLQKAGCTIIPPALFAT